MTNDVVIAVMAKAPIPGYAKTRLIPELGKEGAAELQKRLTTDLIHRLTGALPIQLWCAPDKTDPFFRQFEELGAIKLKRQPDSDLGSRMHHICEMALCDYQAVIIVGTDIPAIDLAMIRGVISALDDHDAVILPVEDGGYGLLGLKQNHHELFDAINWGTSAVYQQTIEQMQQLNMRYHVLPMAWDIDRVQDLKRLN